MASLISFFTGLNRACHDKLTPREGDSIRDLITGIEAKLDFDRFDTVMTQFANHLKNFDDPHEIDASVFLDEILQMIYAEYLIISSPATSPFSLWKETYLYSADFLELIRRMVLNDMAYDKLAAANTADELVVDKGGAVSITLSEDWGVRDDDPIQVSVPTWDVTRDGFLERLFNPLSYSNATPSVQFMMASSSLTPPILYSAQGLPNDLSMDSEGNLTGRPLVAQTSSLNVVGTDATGTSESITLDFTTNISTYVATTPDIFFASNDIGDLLYPQNPPIYNSSWHLPDFNLKAPSSGTYAYAPVDTTLKEIPFFICADLGINTSDTTAREILKVSDAQTDADATSTVTLGVSNSDSGISLYLTYSHSGAADVQVSEVSNFGPVVIAVTQKAISVYGYSKNIAALLGTLDISSIPLTTILSYLSMALPMGLQVDTTKDTIEEISLYPIRSTDTVDTVALGLLASM